MGDQRHNDREALLRNLKTVATTGKPTKEYQAATQEAKCLLDALETSKVLDRETLKRPVNI